MTYRVGAALVLVLPIALVYHSMEDVLQVVLNKVQCHHASGGERFTCINKRWEKVTEPLSRK